MQNYKTNSLGSMLVKIALVVIGIIAVIWIFQRLIGFVVTMLIIAAIVIGVVMLIRFLGRSNNTPRY